MRENPANVRVACGHAADHEADDGTGRVLPVLERRLALDAGHQRAAAWRILRVDEHDRLAPVQLLVERRENRIALQRLAVRRAHADAVGLEDVKRVDRFAHTAVEIHQRQGGELAESSGVVGDQFGVVLVDLPRDRANFREVGAMPDTRRTERQHASADAGPVHVGNVLGQIPHRTRGRLALGLEKLEPDRRHRVGVDVDATRLRRLRQRAGTKQQCAASDGCQGGREVAPGRPIAHCNSFNVVRHYGRNNGMFWTGGGAGRDVRYA